MSPLPPARFALPGAPSKLETMRRQCETFGIRMWWRSPLGSTKLPPPAKADFMKKAAEFRLEMLTEPSSYMLPLACEALGQLKRPILLVTGSKALPCSSSSQPNSNDVSRESLM